MTNDLRLPRWRVCFRTTNNLDPRDDDRLQYEEIPAASKEAARRFYAVYDNIVVDSVSAV